MDLLDALGVTRQQVLVGAGVGLVAAALLAAYSYFRPSREGSRDGLGLHER